MKVFILAMALAVSLTFSVSAADLKPFPSFDVVGKKGQHVVGVDFQSQKLSIVFDIAKKKAIGHSVIVFKMIEAGMPVIDLVPSATKVVLDGKEIPVAEYKNVKSPDSISTMRMLGVSLAAGTEHEVQIEYNLDSATYTMNSTGASVGFWTSDLDDRSFLEQYAPANFEYDQYTLSLDMQVLGAKSEQSLYVNGVKTVLNANHWSVEFPSYFNSSSFYIHLSATKFFEKSGVLKGIEKDIPIMSYAKDQKTADQGYDIAIDEIKSLETSLGAWPHAAFVAYVKSGGGGMEYCGGTISSVDSDVLRHEIFHSYFARGVMPANGNSGWIDEAIAVWHDDGFISQQIKSDVPVDMVNHSEWRRNFDRRAYDEGAAFIEEISFQADNSGKQKLLPAIREYFQANKHTVVTTEEFSAAIQELLGMELDALFDRYIYGKSSVKKLETAFFMPREPKVKRPVIHRRFTEQELIDLR